MAAFTLAHLSDPHLPPLPRPRLTELAGKRAFGYLNWTRNRHLYHRRDVLDVLISDLQAQVPDHIAITGDLVNLALEAEFTLAKAWLETVGPPQRVTVVPGNHDAYVRATAHRFSATWGSYLAGDDTQYHDGTIFPALRRRGPLALVSVSSAVPTPPLMATAAFQRAHQASDRFIGAPWPLEAIRRGTGATRPRPRSFHDLDRGAKRTDSGDRRALGFRAGARALSRRCLQPVFDCTRRHNVALPTNGAEHQRSPSGSGSTTRAAGVVPAHEKLLKLASDANF
jgi:hypothetical protein